MRILLILLLTFNSTAYALPAKNEPQIYKPYKMILCIKGKSKDTLRSFMGHNPKCPKGYSVYKEY